MTLELFLLQCLPAVTAAGQLSAQFLIPGIADEVVHLTGHQTHERFVQLHRALLTYAREKRDLPPNHDLQKALYFSFLSATEVIYQTRLQQLGERIDRHWLAGLRSEIFRRPRPVVQELGLCEPEKKRLNRLLSELRDELLGCPGISSEDLQKRMPFAPNIEHLRGLAAETKKSAPLSKSILEHVLATSPWYKSAGPAVAELARKTLWEYIGKFFAEEIKTNDRVSKILDVDLLADTGITLEEVRSELAGFHGAAGALAADVHAVRELVEREFEQEFRVIDAGFLQAAADRDPEPLLNINVGDWPLVAQKRSLQRDAARLITSRVLQSSKDIVFQLIPGEPGSGKTTLLRQVGAMLAWRGCHVIEAGKDAALLKFRYFTTRLTRQAGSRIFVLVDDVFREDRAGLLAFLSDPGVSVPLTIIATTPTFDNQADEIRSNTYVRLLDPVPLDELNDQELDDLRRMPLFRELSERKFKALTRSRKILPVMLALSGGKKFDAIISNTAHRLKRGHKLMYDAWGVITTFGRWNLPVPNSLLDLILGDRNFSYRIRNSPDGGSRGLIFPSKYPFKEAWSACHQLIAQAAFDSVYRGEQKEYCERALLRGSADDPEHRVFLGRMFRSLCLPRVGDLPLARDLFQDHEDAILKLADSSPEAGADWGLAFLALEKNDLARAYALRATPRNASQACARSRLLDKLGDFAGARGLADEWCRAHPDDNSVRGYYLSLVQAHVTDPQSLEDVVRSTVAWLAEEPHQDDTYVRGRLLNFVQACVTDAKTLAAVGSSTAKWLGEHLDDTFVRGNFLGFVQAGVKRPRVVSAVVRSTTRWLARHEDDTYTRGNYLGLVQARCDGEPVRKAIRDAVAWLKRPAHSGDTHVRLSYLAMVNAKGLKHEVEQALSSTGDWLHRYNFDPAGRVRAHYLRLLQQRQPGRLPAAIEDAAEWLRKNPAATQAWLALIDVLVGCQDFVQSAEVARAALDANPDDATILNIYLHRCRKDLSREELLAAIQKLLRLAPDEGLLQLDCADWLSGQRDYEGAEKIFEQWRPEFGGAYQFQYRYGWHLYRQEKYAEAERSFGALLAARPQHRMALAGMGETLRKLAGLEEASGNTLAAKRLRRQAEKQLKSALAMTERLKMATARFHTSLGWLYFEWKRFGDALAQFGLASAETPHFLNYWGEGEVLLARKRYGQALESLRKAYELAPQPLEPPAGEQIPRLIEECEKALHSLPGSETPPAPCNGS